jgi:hypothetical protein
VARIFSWEKKELAEIFEAELREDSSIIFLVFTGERVVVATAAVGVPP